MLGSDVVDRILLVAVCIGANNRDFAIRQIKIQILKIPFISSKLCNISVVDRNNGSPKIFTSKTQKL